MFLSKKITKLIFFLKINETGSNRRASVRFGFLGQKPVQTGLTWFFFQFGFGLIFSVSDL
jgi:hypothetical protein